MAKQDVLDAIARRWAQTSLTYGQRDVRFQQLFSAYDGKVWSSAQPQEHEQRVTVRLVADVVDMDVAILISRLPIVTVPPSHVSGVETAQASLLENAIIGAWNMMGFHLTLHDAVWFASLTGWGVLRGPIRTNKKPFPLICYAADPRSCYPGFTATRELQWNFYTQYRTAGDIRREVTAKLDGVWHKKALPAEDDKIMLWSEYWGWHGVDLNHAVFVKETTDQGVVMGTPPPSLPKQGTAGGLRWQDAEIGNVLKDPTPMQGTYPDIPFHYFFPRSCPRSEPGHEGMSIVERVDELQKAMSMLVTVLSTDALTRGSVPYWGDGTIVYPLDSDGHGYIDTSAGGFTQFSPGSTLNPLPGAMDAALVKQLYSMLEDLAGRSSFPRSMFGQYESAMSGLAMNVLNNPVLIKEALAQKQIEKALEKFNSFLLQMLRKLPSTTEIFGQSRRGAAFAITQDEVPKNDFTYNIVQLSASLPKDVPALIASLVQVAQVKGVSLRSLMEYVQNLLDLPNKDPEWEFERLAEEEVNLAKQNIDTMAAITAYQTLVQTKMLGEVPIGGAQGGGGGGTQAAGAGSVPSNVMPPQAQGMGAGLEQGLAMQGTPMPQGMVPGVVSGQQGTPP